MDDNDEGINSMRYSTQKSIKTSQFNRTNAGFHRFRHFQANSPTSNKCAWTLPHFKAKRYAPYLNIAFVAGIWALCIRKDLGFPLFQRKGPFGRNLDFF